ncbi:MAG: leucyl aminopeptidase [Actinomycetales bacterium]|nr:leucyl aminopeptidase [Actinomycetales bacterium]
MSRTFTQSPVPATPGLDALDAVTVAAGSAPDGVQAVGYTVAASGDVPAALGLDREALSRAGFEGKPGSVLALPSASGPGVFAVGVGDDAPTGAALRDAAAAFVRAASRWADVALVVADVGGLDAVETGRVLAEGVALGRYRYAVLQSDSKHVPLERVTFDVAGFEGTAGADGGRLADGIAAGLRDARATVVARDLANTPPGRLTATDFGTVAQELGARFGFDVELFDKAALEGLGCGGLLGVNQGSAEEPRMIKLSYTPHGEATGHLGLVGKGIMYDSGGISLKPSDPMHLLMKMDMGGAAAVLGAFTALRDAGATARVTGWLMCTDNMPSGSSYKLGDVLVARGGTTIEVKNTDAEGRLVMCDALVLATEDGVDAIVDIATLTGAALMSLGQARAPFFATDEALADAVSAAAESADEPVWRFPLERKYRSQLDSGIADIANLGGKYAGATTAALFLEHFVGETPWAHLDIAGTMQSDSDDSWRSKGATGYGARILLHTAATFSR